MKTALRLVLIAWFSTIPLSLSARETTKVQRTDRGQKPSESVTAQLGLPDLLTRTVTFLYEDKTPPGSANLVEGRILGTAFVIGVPYPRDSKRLIPFIVTAKHVVADRARILGRYSPKSAAKPLFVQYDLQTLRKDNDLWEYPGDEGVDIVVFRTLYRANTQITPIPIDRIASREVYASQCIDAPDRVVIPSLLAQYPGVAANFPIFRDGSIALITDEPIEFTWKCGRKPIATKQRIIFVNSTLNEGFSGAPVFLWPGIRLTPKGNTVGGKPWLLGVVHGFQRLLRPVVDSDGHNVTVDKQEKADPNAPGPPKPPGDVAIFSQENSAVGVVFPSWQILEIVQSDAVKKRIQELAEEERLR